MGCTAGIDPAYGVLHMSSKGPFRTRVSNHHCSSLRKRTVGAVAADIGPLKVAADRGMQTVENELYLPGRVAGSTIHFLVDTREWFISPRCLARERRVWESDWGVSSAHCQRSELLQRRPWPPGLLSNSPRSP